MKYKRIVVFLKGADEFKPRRSRGKCSKRFERIQNQVLAKRPSTEERLLR